MKIEMQKYTVEVNNAETVAAAMDSLPIYQSIRGCDQWTQEKRDALVKDILGGLYVPPIVFAVEIDEETGEKRLVIIDGQQRGRAIRDAVKNGTMPKDTPIITAVDNGRTGEDAFRVLNIGCPVGSALVTAVSLDGTAGKALLACAKHSALSLIPWSAIQNGRTEKAAFAASALAIAAGWLFVESSTKATEKWLKDNAEAVDDDAKAKALAVLNRIAAALVVLDDIAKDGAQGMDGATMDEKTAAKVAKARAKAARRALGTVRKKNNFISLVQAVADDYDAMDVIALFSDSLVWAKGGTYQPSREDGKGRLKKAVAIPTGAGSSGSLIDTARRFDAVKYFLDGEGDYNRDIFADTEKDATEKAADKAAKKALECDTSALKAALGM